VTDGDGNPARVTEEMRRVRNHMQKTWLDWRDERGATDFPYATTHCASHCGLRDPSQASRIIRRLVSVGVVDHVGSLPPRPPRKDGTKLYAPGQPDEART
jgi:hypothetical protein